MSAGYNNILCCLLGWRKHECSLLCPLSLVPGHARRYGIGPFSVFEAPQHGGAFDLQVLVAAESDHVADCVVKLDGGHAAPDHSARVRAGLNTCEHEAIQSAGSGTGCEERLRNRYWKADANERTCGHRGVYNVWVGITRW